MCRHRGQPKSEFRQARQATGTRRPGFPNWMRTVQERKGGYHIWVRQCRGCRWSRGDRGGKIEREIGIARQRNREQGEGIISFNDGHSPSTPFFLSLLLSGSPSSTHTTSSTLYVATIARRRLPSTPANNTGPTTPLFPMQPCSPSFY